MKVSSEFHRGFSAAAMPASISCRASSRRSKPPYRLEGPGERPKLSASGPCWLAPCGLCNPISLEARVFFHVPSNNSLRCLCLCAPKGQNLAFPHVLPERNQPDVAQPVCLCPRLLHLMLLLQLSITHASKLIPEGGEVNDCKSLQSFGHPEMIAAVVWGFSM